LDSRQRQIFILSYLTYASYYLTRLSFSVALPVMQLDLGYSKFGLGLIGGLFSISYALGQFVNGQLAEKGARRLVLIGLVLSVAMNLLFGYMDALIFLMIVWSVNGYAQSTGWPSVVKIIRNWFRSGDLGSIGGLFGSCFLVGNMVSWFALGWIVANFGWRAVFLLPALPVILVASLFYLYVSDEPTVRTSVNKVEGLGARYRLQQILSSKRLITIAIAYTLLQFVRSGFTLWAPSYLLETYSVSLDVASYMSAVIPLGGIIGSVTSGWLSDRVKKFGRVPVISALILFLSFLIPAFYSAASYGLQAGLFLLLLSGFALYGPHVIMATVVPMEQEESYGVAGVAGFIDGIGYIGLLFADPFIGWTIDVHGWNGVVTFWLLSSVAAAFLTLILWFDEATSHKA